ncbi:hypothetical protein [Dinoroseobacter sp. S76]|uniref:hypothetical protein n=1 Tax=Dinoroseobacter sp. S76 TaxID=3415124 RepID=UPI003C7A904C
MGSKIFDVSVRPTENGFTVSWTDKFKGYNSDRILNIGGVILGIIYISFFVLALQSGDDPFSAALFAFLNGLIPLAILAGILNITWRAETSVKFTRSEVTLNENTYSTDTISRFDYGLRSQLTGKEPAKRKDGSSFKDPYMVRMWINDLDAVTISTNDLPPDYNHKIRNILESTLEDVKAEPGSNPGKRRVTEETPQTSPTDRPRGMPDY